MKHLAIEILPRNLTAVLVTLAEEAELKRCPIAKGLYTFCATYRFVASVYLQADILPHLTRLSKVFQQANVNFLHIKEQVPITIETLRRIKHAGETLLPGSFLSHLHQDLDEPLALGAFTIHHEEERNRRGQGVKDLPREEHWTKFVREDENQAEIMTLLASECNEWGQIYPLLSRLAAIALVIPVSSVNCERDFSTMNRVKSDLRNRLQGEQLPACLRVSINGLSQEAFNYQRALELFFSKTRTIKCPNSGCKVCK
ncbi:uncharacterized protein LOC127358382 isoform X2 [Dicentrarchus labrax]|uniref:uncharacterized protein LOC127358382 isoform X2 n=1 Tax=Dicentrarchus labrax TaxID=13489 RepID=UPI0021F54B0A|nr:uncharacterized protein LOC127358382 isoform X2 [Dicentrarchus labrax]